MTYIPFISHQIQAKQQDTIRSFKNAEGCVTTS